MAPELSAQDVIPVEVDFGGTPLPAVRVVPGEAAFVDAALVLEGKDAGLLLQGSLLDGEASGRFFRRIGVIDQRALIWKPTGKSQEGQGHQ